jgi:UDP-2,4-diacetamido-2,4,6-trideoxy-beta-L-altropyranose hydrolase
MPDTAGVASSGNPGNLRRLRDGRIQVSFLEKSCAVVNGQISDNLFIRADAGFKIGAGHVMRCIALAQAWQDRGGTVTFISHCDGEALRERIQIEGFRFISLDLVCPDSYDLMNTLSILKNESADQKPWLVLDGYHFTPEYQNAIRDEGILLLVIDDMNHLPIYHADILLNQNIHAPDLNYHCDEDTTLLLGPSYVLLRREFLKYRDFKRQIPDRAKNILVTIGGADPDNVTLKVIEALKHLGEPDNSVRIIVGPANPHQESLRNALAAVYFEVELLVNPPNMPELIAWADMAVSAGGSTCWELAFMGVPSIVLILAENQAAVAEYLVNNKTIVNIGRIAEISEEHISHSCKSLIHDNIRRKYLSEQSRMLISAQGASLIIESIHRRSLTLRDVTDLDRELIWHWANDEETRKASYSQANISWDEHIRWFDSVQRQKNHRFYIANNGCKKPVGQIRFALDGKDAIVSFSVAPESRRRGYGKEILIKAAKKLFNETNIEQISAYVKSENILSLRVFQKAGFRMMGNVIFCGVKSCKMILRRPALS